MLKRLAIVVVTTLLAVNAYAWQNPLQNRYLKGKPLEIRDQGSFFVGGVPKVTRYASSATVPEGGPPQQITIGQAYVQFDATQIRDEMKLWQDFVKRTGIKIE